MKHESWIAVVSVSGVIIDRILKSYVVGFPEGKVFSFGVLEFGHFLNPFLFFSPAWRFIPWLALAVLVALTTFYVLRSTFRPGLLPILLGGASNVFDRFAFGGVIDVLSLDNLATINLADFLILGGLLMLIFQKRGTMTQSIT